MNYYVYIQWPGGQPEHTRSLGSPQAAVAWAEARSKAWLGHPGAPLYFVSYNPSGQRVATIESGKVSHPKAWEPTATESKRFAEKVGAR